jgi:hypothetical protein
VNCGTGDALAGAQEQAAGKEAVLKALDAAEVSLRSKLGESLSSVQKYATPVEEATTPSLEALKAYSLGRKMQSADGDTAALPFFKRAVELDPNFAMAYSAMSGVYDGFLEPSRAEDLARKAYDLREKVSERERFAIEGALLPDSDWPAPTLCKATPPRPRRPMGISSRSGKTPTRTSPSSSQPKPNTQNCSRSWWNW